MDGAAPRQIAADDVARVNRFEVIDHRAGGEGRVLVRYGVSVALSLQDDGRTLKAFLTDGAPAEGLPTDYPLTDDEEDAILGEMAMERLRADDGVRIPVREILSEFAPELLKDDDDGGTEQG